MKALLVLPVIIPLCTAAVSLLFWSRRRVQRGCSAAGAAALLAAGAALMYCVWFGGIASTQVGDWPAPFGITFVADVLGAVMVVLAGIVGVAVVGYSLTAIDRRREAFGFHPLVHALLAGVCGAFLTGDLFNMYVWFEVMLIASFVLMGLGGERAQMVGAVKYVVLNLVSSSLFLGAVGILYRLTGTLNLADLSRTLGAVGDGTGAAGGAAVTVTSMLFLVAFGIKAAIFPLFFWLPASYHTPPVVISALFAGLLTKVGVYALIRVFTLLFIGDVGYTHRLILVLAGLTMITGVLGAVAQRDVRIILSFHIVSQIGYMIMGLGIYTPLALAGSVFYILHHIVVKTNLFLIAGVIERAGGSFDLARVGGLFKSRPGLSALFLVSALSLAGLPPLSGFFAKLALVKAGLEAREYTIVAVSLAVSLLTLYSMTKIWNQAFWEPAPDGRPDARDNGRPPSPGEVRRLTVPVAGLAAVTLAVSAAAAPVFAVASRAAEQLMNPAEYVRAVLEQQDVRGQYARR